MFLVLGESEDVETVVIRLDSPELDGFSRGGADHAFANLLVSCVSPNEIRLIVTCPLFMGDPRPPSLFEECK